MDDRIYVKYVLLDGKVNVRSRYQWDHGVQINVTGMPTTNLAYIEFANEHMTESIRPESTIDESGTMTCMIPDSLFMMPYPVIGYVILADDDSMVTAMSIVIPVTPRAKPADYICTPDEVIRFNDLVNKLNLSIQEVNELKKAVETATGNADASTQSANTAASKINSMTVNATTLAQGSDASVEKTDDGQKIGLTFGIPRGDTGLTPDITMNASTGEPGTDVTIVKSGTAEKPSFAVTIPRGDTGLTPNLTVNVATGDPGTQASVVQSGTVENPVLLLKIPKGDTGDTGATPQISVQVQTGAAGSEASVSMSGTAENPVIHLTIPRGDTGDIGALTINGKAPDAAGAVTLKPEDLGAATSEEVSALKGEKVDKANVVNNFTTTQEGFVADARALKVLNEKSVVLYSGTIGLTTDGITVNLSDSSLNYAYLIVYLGSSAGGSQFCSIISTQGNSFVKCFTTWFGEAIVQFSLGSYTECTVGIKDLANYPSIYLSKIIGTKL